MTKVLITGASTGIGRELALAWASRGATVVLSARSANALEEVAREVRARGGTPVVVPGDVTDAAYRRHLVETATASRLDVLVNNAGRGYYASALAVDLAELRALFELNVFAPLELAQLAAPALGASGGTIVMLSSVAGIVAAPHYSAYSATKFALEAISMAMRAELAPRGVRLLVVRPGPVATPFRANAARGRGETFYSRPDPRSQAPEAVAARILRAVDRGRDIDETSAFVKATSAAARLSPALLRFAFQRMAKRPPQP